MSFVHFLRKESELTVAGKVIHTAIDKFRIANRAMHTFAALKHLGSIPGTNQFRGPAGILVTLEHGNELEARLNKLVLGTERMLDATAAETLATAVEHTTYLSNMSERYKPITGFGEVEKQAEQATGALNALQAMALSYKTGLREGQSKSRGTTIRTR